jgi:transcriptional regulator with XRE-family HTH domain
MSLQNLSLYLDDFDLIYMQKILTFGECIRNLREDTGLPLRKVAAQLDIDPSLLGKIERNQRQPTKDQIRKLALIFNQSESVLFSEYLSDQIAYKILEEESSSVILKVAEKKVKYFKSISRI